MRTAFKIILLMLCVALSARGNDDAGRIPERVLWFFSSGLLAEYQGDYSSALENYEMADMLYPGDAEIQRSIADMYLATGEPGEAYRRFKALLSRYPDNVTYHLGAADAAYGIPIFKEAIKEYKWLIKNTDADFETCLRYVMALVFSGNEKEALNQLEKLKRDFPDAPEPYSISGEIYTTRKDFEKAKSCFRQAIEIDSTYSRAYLGLAAAYEGMGLPDSASFYYEKYVSHEPGDRSVFKMWFRDLLSKGEHKRALDAAKQYLRTSQDDIEILRSSAFLAYDLDDKAYAIKSFEVVLSRDSADWEARYYYGLALMDSGLVKESVHQFETSFDQKREPDIAISLAIAHSLLGERVAAMNVLRQAAIEFPDVADIPYFKGVFLARENKYSLAIPEFRFSLILDPTHKNAMFALGDAFQRTSETDSSFAVFEVYIKKYPGDALALNYYGYMLVEKDERLEYADSLISKAMEIDPDNAAYIDSYGWLLFKRGNFADALTLLLKADELTDPDDPIILEHIGATYEKIGDKSKALEYYKKAVMLDPELPLSKRKIKELK